jgi:hypothetical protein
MAEYSLDSLKWGQGVLGTPGGTVKWSFDLPPITTFSFDRAITEAVYQDLVRRAFDAWEAVIQIDFVEVSSAADAVFTLGWDAIDGPFGTVGEASYGGTSDGTTPLFSTTLAEIRFDTAETWNVTQTPQTNAVNFYTVAVHEIGHTIGLKHTDDIKTVMYPLQQDDVPDLTPGDIAGAQVLYGAKTAVPPTWTQEDDVVSLKNGNENYDGLGGRDAVVIPGNASNFTLSINQNGTLVLDDRNASGGQDTLANIEELRFTDRTLDLNAFSGLTQLSDTQFKALAEMYVAYFNRAPDAEGLFYWADKLAEGRTMDQIAERFFDQDETRGIYTDPSNTDAFVTAVYANVLGRTPDAEGSAFWTGKLAANEVTQGAFVLKIILGAKNGGGPQDVAYLSDKTDLGIYFSAIKGLSDSADGRQVMSTFGDQATSNKTGAKTAIDGHYADATASSGGEFLFDLVGIVADPFAAIV